MPHEPKPIPAASIAAFLLLLAIPAHAIPTLFTDRAAWEVAAGGTPDIYEDFDAFPEIGPPSGHLVDAGTFTVQGASGNIDAGMLDMQTLVDLTPYYRASLISGGAEPDVVTYVFDLPVSSWGADTNPHGDNPWNSVNFLTDAGESGSFLLGADITEFHGFTTLLPFTTVTFSTTDPGLTYGQDNAAAHYSVPEPSTAAMLLLGLVATSVSMRREREQRGVGVD